MHVFVDSFFQWLTVPAHGTGDREKAELSFITGHTDIKPVQWTHRNKLHANKSIFCSDFLSRSPLASVGILYLPLTSPLLRHGLLLILMLKVLINFGKKKKLRGIDRWHLVSVSVQSRVYSVTVKFVDLHTSFCPPRLGKHTALLQISSSGQLMPIWMQMRRGKCLDTLSFASK